MAEKYFVTCNCGQSIRVELPEAGTSKRCPKCGQEVVVPNTIKLKELSGDKYPWLRPVEKIQRSLAASEPPFDGWCHSCGDAAASHQVPILLESLVERVVENDGGIRPTITGIELYAGAAEEHWETTGFPLLLCSQCHDEFLRMNSRVKFLGHAKTATLIALLLLFLYCAYHNFEAIAALSGLLWLIALVAWIISVRKTKSFDPFVQRCLSNIRWVPETIDTALEYKLIIEVSRPFEKNVAQID